MKQALINTLILFSLFSSSIWAQENSKSISEETLPEFRFDHNHQLFETFISMGLDYPVKRDDIGRKYNFYQWKKNKVLLESYLNYLRVVDLKQFDKFSKKEKLSFIINLYNAEMILILLENMPIRQLSEINRFGSSFYSRRYIQFLGGKTSFMKLEKSIINLMDNGLYVFLLYRGSYSSPYISSAINPDNVDSLLKETISDYLSKNTQFYKETKTIFLPKLFLWQRKNIEKKTPLIDFLKKYYPVDKNYEIKYLQYNWKVNSYWFEDPN